MLNPNNITSTTKKTWLAIASSSLLFTLMFPVATGGDQWPITSWSCLFTWIFLVPLWVHIRHSKPNRILWTSFLFCFFSTLGTLFWFYIAMKKYGDMPAWQAILVLIGAGLVFGALRWIAFLVTSRFQDIQHFPLFAALTFTLTEWGMLYIPCNGFSWMNPAYGLVPMHHIIQSADFLGITGICFLIFYSNFLIVEGILQYKNNHTFCKRPLIGISIVLLLLLMYGHHQIQTYSKDDTGEVLRIALLQGNISQDLKWSSKERHNIIQEYQNLSITASQESPDMIVWPEASFPRTIHVDETQLEVIPPEIQNGTFIIGAPTWSNTNGKRIYKNTAFTTDAKGVIQHRYDKAILVPFGEYVPSFGFINIEKIVPSVAGSFTAGGLDQEISKINGHPFGLFICFEILFPYMASMWNDKGAEFFVTITNDAWFDLSSGPYQHLNFGSLRAIEFRKPLVRAANTGVTTWFDAAGIQQKFLPLLAKGIVMAKIHPNQVRTLHAQFPNAIPAFLWIATLYIIVFQRKRRI